VIETLLAAPVIVKVLVSLILILVVHAIIKHLLAAVLFGALTLALWCGFDAATALDIAWLRFSSLDNVLLMVLILEVIWLSTLMTETGVMRDLVEAVRMRVSRRASMAALPAVIGFLPMPGGALFSAPLVDECDEGRSVPSMYKVRTNYWFRHVWEYWWPLYPGVLLALDVTGLHAWQFVLLQIPFSLVAIAAGYWFLLRKIDPEDEEAPRENRNRKPPAVLPLIAPIILVIVIYSVLQLAWPGLGDTNKYLPLIFGMTAALLFVQRQRPLGLPQWKKIIFSQKALIMVLLVAAVQIYGAYIEGRLPDGSLLVARMREELGAWGIPPQAMMMVLPFVAGFTTGLTIGFVGAGMPIVISLLGDGASMSAFLGAVSLSYISGFAGMILSPVHICLIVTNEHFKTRLLASLMGLIKPTAVVVLAALLYYLFWHFLWTGL
jgi:integral membrane protein (TIGR00529 family)